MQRVIGKVKTENSTLIDWIGMRRILDFSKARKLGPLVFGSAVALATTLLAGTLIQFMDAIWNGDDKGEALRNTGLAFAAMISVPFLIWRSLVAQKQVDVAEQGQITDRINKAVQGLGAEKVVKTQRKDSAGNLTYRKKDDDRNDYSQPVMIELTKPNLEVRIGAIYSLERIAQDSERDHIQIMEILCAYVRENSPATTLVPREPPFEHVTPRTDIATVISVLARRSAHQREIETKSRYRLNLSNSELSGMDFLKGDFSGTKFHGARLEGADFQQCKLYGTQFLSALLNYVDWHSADLMGARLDSAVINRPKPSLHGMNSTLNMAKFVGINLSNANISAVDYFGEPEETNHTFGNKGTTLSEKLENNRSYLHHLQIAVKIHEHGENQADLDQAKNQLDETGFREWSPYDHQDAATIHLYYELQETLGLTDFPFRD